MALLMRPIRRRCVTAVIAVLGLHAAGCRSAPERRGTYGDPLLEARRQKDEAFRAGPQSPLRDEDRARFRGLEYFPASPAYRFRVKLERYPEPAELRMRTNTAEIRRVLRYGYFEFAVDGKTCRLQVYKVLDDAEAGPATLFVPFRDATSARETYGGGRYLDLEENTTGSYDLDFNRAYNPSCAYGKDYSCPIPPAENTLPVAIRAGEKSFPVAPSH
jgi:uncharacterized protein (DUF1684 family)